MEQLRQDEEQKYGSVRWVIGGLLLLIIAACASSPQETPQPSSPSTTPVPAATCTTKACFIPAANDCAAIDLTLTEEAGTFRYVAKDCVFTKTLVSLDQTETQDMKDLLQGKSLTCRYEKGKFDPRWVNSLLFGTEYCEGELKDRLAELLLFT